LPSFAAPPRSNVITDKQLIYNSKGRGKKQEKFSFFPHFFSVFFKPQAGLHQSRLCHNILCFALLSSGRGKNFGAGIPIK